MPKVVDADQYRKELLYQCFDLFAEKGYANVTTRQISKELGISTGALYHYFPSKESLFEQLVEELGHQDIQVLKGAVVAQKTLLERVKKLGELLLENREYLVKQAAIWMDFYQYRQGEPILANPVFRRIDQQYQQAMAEFLGINDLSKARFVWVLVDGILIDQVATNDPAIFTEQVWFFVEMVTAYFEKYPVSE
ncbi:TetR/AcrR family transcriptional regulator [Limnoraphis robusta Tam1]|uniref:TetR/AcrR family transcriptional regulator n=1 Tax=Limnoraphis robusta CCNP1315 TaxID=3110306 RepID=A0ABU5TU55_9CYAN|nr:TetR/AcrR family transcriptional regulator [Limnoraphis robusta]MEA5496084.1 TetR/AcrR family transcriptional regulator [Limnoraphis robusta BA-68 BA1]MEA5518423.1 TetR/AcrR family transcriptional regulator [Limnoraphis robusta CCNP1315]MEA5542741.1 TetR/AcrR family transcriptional regulator [Limnoraphis robusta Tam1]MEA5547115.1 TetR/AcrR family transcriptional regulator [Limnoraphis robusta CCNP1324]